jgi:hypothetical protein
MSSSLGVCTEPYLPNEVFLYPSVFFAFIIYTLGTMCDLSLGVWLNTCYLFTYHLFIIC